MKKYMIADRYAKGMIALFTLEEFSSLRVDIAFLLRDLKENQDLLAFLASPLIKTADKMNLFKEISATLHHEDRWNHLMDLLIQKNREAFLDVILEEIDRLLLEQLNLCKVNIRVAHEMSDTLKEELETKVSSILNQTILTTYTLDPTIIGGFIAETSSQIIDASMKNNIERFTANSQLNS
ncbi:MAG: ATP synthase F1 subunit delta [Candidatus Zophobacter franzmannii]|nr:ATP synthase F1 subunit delta [Candidatus Zophobacter franzmannii]